jgi:hypothetical protein
MCVFVFMKSSTRVHLKVQKHCAHAPSAAIGLKFGAERFSGEWAWPSGSQAVVVVVQQVVVARMVAAADHGAPGEGQRSLMVALGGVAVVVAGVALLRLLPLAVLLVLHAAVLEPDLYLALRQVEVARQLPPLLLGHVGVEEELLLQLQRLELGVGLAFLAHRHVARPLERVAAAQHACEHDGTTGYCQRVTHRPCRLTTHAT